MWTNRKYADIDTVLTTLYSRGLFYTLLTAAVLFNGWMLEGFIYTYQAWSHMWISEIEIVSQPWSWLFRSLDASSYLAMLFATSIAVFALVRYKGPAKSWMCLAFTLVGIMALLGFFDLTHSLDCVRYQHPICLAQVTTHAISRTAMLHSLESHATAAASILYGVVVAYIIRLHDKTSRLYPISSLIAVGITGTLCILGYSNSLFVESIAQRSWNTFLSLQFVVLAYYLRKTAQAKQAPIQSFLFNPTSQNSHT